jgi:hypothetical protein
MERIEHIFLSTMLPMTNSAYFPYWGEGALLEPSSQKLERNVLISARYNHRVPTSLPFLYAREGR